MDEEEKDDAFDEAFADDAAQVQAEGEQPVTHTDEKPEGDSGEQEAGAESAGEGENDAAQNEPAQDEQPHQDTRIEPEQFKGYLDEREKRQQAEADKARLKAQLEQLQQSQRREETPPPDIYENPDEYRSYIEAQVSQRITQERLVSSEFYARQQYGDELVDQVKAWAQALSPERAAPLTDKPMPYMAAVDAYRQEQANQTLKAHDYDLDKLKQEWLEEYKAQQAGQQLQQGDKATEQKPKPKLPPKVANSGGVQSKAPQMSEDDFFVSVFEG